MTKQVRYFCDRCGKELSWCDYSDRRIRARLLGRSFLICGACDAEFCQWLHNKRRFKE